MGELALSETISIVVIVVVLAVIIGAAFSQ